MNISKKFNLNISGHKDIDFIDVDDRLDTKLFLDPYVIQALDNEFCFNARKCIDSFFYEVFKTCREQNTNKLRMLLQYASEPNETNLGMKLISDYGKGTTADELSKLFLDFYKTVRRNPYLENNPLALCMYIKNFAEDKMSDLITNIIRKQLYYFTLKQSNIWNIPLKQDKAFIGYYWDFNKLVWENLYGFPLCTGHKNILLIPKLIIRTKYVLNVENYIKQYILKTLQNEHFNKNSDMCLTKELANRRKKIHPPSIDELYKKEVHNTVHKDYASSYSTSNKNRENDYIEAIGRRIRNGYGSIPDEQLDKIVYKRTVKSVS